MEPGRRVRLPRDFDPAGHPARSSAEAKAILAQGIELLAEYQMRLAAQDTHGVVVVLQAMDAAGKDGTIRHVMSGVNPQGVEVQQLQDPVAARSSTTTTCGATRRRLPERGNIGIFNRSYYEEVLVVRVHPQILANQKIPPKLKDGGIWNRRFREINDWEHYLTDQGFRFVKLFLNLSARRSSAVGSSSRIDEPDQELEVQRQRRQGAHVLGRLPEGIRRRPLEDEHRRGRPWYVIPADDKPFARVAAAGVLANALIEIDPRFPKVVARRPDGAPGGQGGARGAGARGRGPDPNEVEARREGARSRRRGRRHDRADRSASAGAAQAAAGRRVVRAVAGGGREPAQGRPGGRPDDRPRPRPGVRRTAQNTFAEAKKASKWQMFVRQYADPMQVVLLVAGIVCLFLPGQFYTGVFLLLLTDVQRLDGDEPGGQGRGERLGARER